MSGAIPSQFVTCLVVLGFLLGTSAVPPLLSASSSSPPADSLFRFVPQSEAMLQDASDGIAVADLDADGSVEILLASQALEITLQ